MISVDRRIDTINPSIFALFRTVLSFLGLLVNFWNFLTLFALICTVGILVTVLELFPFQLLAPFGTFCNFFLNGGRVFTGVGQQKKTF